MTQQYGTVKVDVITYTSGTGGSETDQSITVSSLATISRTGITVTGDINANNIYISGVAQVSGLATVSGLIVGQNATITGDLVVGSGIQASSLVVQDDATVSGALGVSGLATVSGLTVTNDTNLNTLTVTGNSDFEDVAVSGNLTVTGSATISGDLTVSGDISGQTDGGINGSGYWKLPSGTTAQRPGSPLAGMVRWNQTRDTYEGYDGTQWGSIGGSATGSGTDKVFILNEQTVTTSYTIPNDHNATSCGPITINDSVDVVIGDGENWSIV